MATQNVPLKIRFIDSISSLRIGRQLRIEVTRGDGSNERVPVEQLDFSFAPIAWGSVKPGPEVGTGIVSVIALAKSRDVYDRPKYEVSATFKARGETSLETINRFALAFTAPVVELRFFVRDEDIFEEFHPQDQATPLKAEDFDVTPPGAAEIFLSGETVFARVLKPLVKPRVTCRFPNGEKAWVDLDFARAGLEPTLDSLKEPPSRPDDGAGPRGVLGQVASAMGRLVGLGAPAATRPGADADPVADFDAPASPPSPPAGPPAARVASVSEDAAWSAPQKGGALPAADAEVGEGSQAAPSETSAAASHEEVHHPLAAASDGPDAEGARAFEAGGGSPTADIPAPTPAPSPPDSSRRRVDPSAGLRSEILKLRRDIDVTLANGLVPVGQRDKLLKRIDGFRGVVKTYRGPDVDDVRAFFERTLGRVEL